MVKQINHKSKTDGNDDAGDADLSAFQIKERKQKTCFVGNLPLEMTGKQVKNLFIKEGFKVEKVWFRSICVLLESKTPNIRAKVITKEHGDQKDSKNAYVLLESADMATAASKKLNQMKLEKKHIRVDVDYREERYQNDFESTIFIGNLPFITNEEDLRAHFMDNSGGEGENLIQNVRIIRDPKTFIGKGIAYVQFKDKPTMRMALEAKNGMMFHGRELRMKKAVEPRRLEKKAKGKEDRKAGLDVQRQQTFDANTAQMNKTKEQDDEISRLRNFEKSAYQNEDSDDEEANKLREKKRAQKEKKLEAAAKEQAKEQELVDQFMKINNKSKMYDSKSGGGQEIDITPKLGHKKSVHNRIMQEKIDSQQGKSKYEDLKNKTMFKDQLRMRDMLKEKIEKTKNRNMKRINVIKVKKVTNK